MDNTSYTIRVPKRLGRIAAIVGVLALIVAPLSAVATHSFNDVPNSHTFHGNIEWLKASGVTKGCNPPANTLFCPDDNVTRGQMAAFMERFAEYLGAEDGTPAQADNATTADSAGTAEDATLLDGQALIAYTHTTTAGNTAADCTFLDNPQLNGNPGALVHASHEFTISRLDKVLGVFYEGSLDQWCVFLEDASNMPAGHTLQIIAIDPPGSSSSSMNESQGEGVPGS